MKETIRDIVSREGYRPLRIKDFYYLLGAYQPSDKEKVKRALGELCEGGELSLNSRERYEPSQEQNAQKGIYRAGKGNFGFVEIEDELFPRDVFILGSLSLGAFDGDEVLVRITKEGTDSRNPEGKVVKILSRAQAVLVGTFRKRGKFAFVIPQGKGESRDIYIPQKNFNGAKNFDVVQVEITKFPDSTGENREGRVLRVLGSSRDDGMDITSLIVRTGLREEFSPEAEREAESLKSLKLDKEYQKRVDLTGERIFTIDGATAKDLDDAVGISRTQGGYRLTVSIADVSFFVKEKGAIDQEAYERGTSVYFPDRAVPMLPRALCEDLCSLNPGEKKLAFTAEMEIGEDGRIIDAQFYKSVICSCARMVYDEVNQLLLGEEAGLDEKYLTYRDDLFLMKDLAEKLAARRKKNGGVDLDIDEPFIEVDERGNAIDVYPRARGEAEKIIEDFMLAANRSVAEFIFHTGVPGIYRVHDDPDAERLTTFRRFAEIMGQRIRLKKEHYSGQLQEFLEKIKGRDEEFLLKKVLLRCMKKAEYRTDSTSHFALAFPYYTHFTSPIRRYPDLVTHRILGRIVEGSVDSEYVDALNETLAETAYQCSRCEKRAEEAEREGDKLKIAQYMQTQRGYAFEGVICSVLNFGMFVQLSNLAEGLVRYSDMQDDYYLPDVENMRAIGERTGRVRKVGDKVFAEVAAVNRESGEIDLLLLEADEVEEVDED